RDHEARMLEQSQQPVSTQDYGVNAAPAATIAENYRSFLGDTRGASLIVDAAGRCVEVNADAEALLGYRRDELLQRQVADFVISGLDLGCWDQSRGAIDEWWQGE